MAQLDDAASRDSTLAFVRGAMRRPLLTREREFELARRWRETGDQTALHELVNAYTRLVIATAARFRHYGLSFADLIQEGHLGLMQAAARFEPSREVRFSTYAAWWIRSQMQDFILRNWSIVRTGTTAAHKSLFFNLRRLRARIDRGAGAGAARLTREQKQRIARELDVTLADVDEMEGRLSGADASLNHAVGEDGESQAQDFLADERPDPEASVAEAHDRRMRLGWLAEALAALSPRERTIIAERRLREEGVTLEELGRELGVSKERVRQLEQRALVKLKGLLAAKAGDDPSLLMA
jgi:RNA polymerase sigma-32 factor